MAETLPVAVWERADAIEGWLYQDEAELLHRLNTGRWCEIGCWKGRSTVVLAAPGRFGYAIDHFKGSPEHGSVQTFSEFQRNTAGLNIGVLRGRFQDMHRHVGPVDLLHLDGDHSYGATLEAFRLYASKVKVGGHVVFHDAWGAMGETEGTPWPGVTRFVGELARAAGWRHVADATRSAAFQRL